MGYISTVSLYSTLLAVGYVITLFRRGQETLKNGNKLHGRLPPLKPLYVHALLSVIFKPKGIPQRLATEGSMPKLSICSQTVAVDADNLAAYKAKCNFPNNKNLPLLYPTVETFCLNLACMCLPAFPISVIGGVLLRYKAVMHKPIQQAEVLTYKYAFSAWAGSFAILQLQP